MSVNKAAQEAEDSKRKRGEESPDQVIRDSKITRRTTTDLEKMEKIQEMFEKMMGEIKDIKTEIVEVKKNQEKMDIVIQENRELKKQVEKLEQRVENMEKESKKRNLIVTGIKMDTNDNVTLKKAMETFTSKVLNVEAKIKSAKKIGENICLMEMESMEEKIKIMKVKNQLKHFKEERVYINDDLTEKERGIQKIIRGKEKEERSKGKNTKVGYQKLIVNGVMWKWNKDKQILVENADYRSTDQKN